MTAFSLDPELRGALAASRRVGSLLLKAEEQEMEKVAAAADDLIRREYRWAGGNAIKDAVNGVCEVRLAWRVASVAICRLVLLPSLAYSCLCMQRSANRESLILTPFCCHAILPQHSRA